VAARREISLKGQVALVTGASKGIGVAVAETLAAAGADMALTARDREGLGETARLCRSNGVKVWSRTAELASADEVRALGRAALAEFGHVDILVNNAGLTLPQPVLEIGEKEWRTTLDVDLYAPLLLTQAIAPGMVRRKRGKIINVSSRAGLGALEDHGAYSAAKAGLQLLTQTMAVEFGPHNVQANCIAPTVILTPMAERVWKPGPRTDFKLAGIPAGRFGKPADVADVVLWLASPLSDYVNGAVIPVDGGEGAR
jgi:NAD(P)-dependent dehydrogenase (short-subunit alcohol dehydrogenase family)